MINDRLAIVLYTSARGHFGYRDCYKQTVEKMKKEIPFFESYYKVAHIKYSDGEEKYLSEMEEFLAYHGFYLKITKGDWKHNDHSHANGYYADMLTVLSDPKLHKYDYVFSFEDDWLINFNDNYTVAVGEALKLLDNNLSALCVRVNHDLHKDTSNAHQELCGFIFQQGMDYTKFGPTYTFQPTITRLKEWYHSVRMINNQIKRNPFLLQQIHCELISGEILKQFSDSLAPFYFFDPSLINATHIGEENWIYENK